MNFRNFHYHFRKGHTGYQMDQQTPFTRNLFILLLMAVKKPGSIPKLLNLFTAFDLCPKKVVSNSCAVLGNNVANKPGIQISKQRG